jgi:hypothetical protein
VDEDQRLPGLEFATFPFAMNQYGHVAGIAADAAAADLRSVPRDRHRRDSPGRDGALKRAQFSINLAEHSAAVARACYLAATVTAVSVMRTARTASPSAASSRIQSQSKLSQSKAPTNWGLPEAFVV